ncbi:MAG: TonB-dependent receptor [Erythrobacter sp.]
MLSLKISASRPVLAVAIFGALTASTVAVPAFAQEVPAPTSTGKDIPPPEDDLHNRQTDSIGNIIVSANGLEQLDILAGTSVFEGAEIQRNFNGQIGEVLAKLPGVSATGFAPGASRPILRGFQGERVKVLIDGLSTADVSNTSVDHATSIDPLTAERIEVLRGPAVLLYGSQAIGGAVNVIDKRIPRRSLDKELHLDALGAFDTASDYRYGGASLDAQLHENVVLHFDGSYGQSDDLEIAGFQVGPELRAELLEEAAEEEEEGEFEEAEEFREAAEQRGVLPNSATETWTVNGGLGILLGESNFGFSVGWYDTNYGVPGRPGAGHHGEEEGEEGGEEEEGEEEEIVTIDLRQFRSDFRADFALGEGFFKQLLFRAGYSDYTHTEFEGAEVGTTFDSESFETRLELVQNERNGWRGSIGAQYSNRDFFAEGAEAYVAPNKTKQYALFALQEFGSGPVQIEAAGRFETTDVDSEPLGVERDFQTFSGAIGAAFETWDNVRFGINLSRAERAPSAEELFSNGPHIATQAFELGDVNLDTESALGIEAYARGNLGGGNFSITVFNQWFGNYIYLEETGLEEDDLPVFQYLQQDATYFGIEGEFSYPFLRREGLTVLSDVRGSYVKAELDDGSAVPRIPPLSLLGALEAQTDSFDIRGEVQWFAEQDDIATFETPTDSFTFVNASVAYRPFGRERGVTLLLAADNIFDVTGRRHASFTKDFVPLAGRNVKASLRLTF